MVFEIIRLIGRINILEIAGSSGVYTSLCVIILILASIILTIMGKKLAPFLLVIVLVINFFTTTLYPGDKIGLITSNFTEIVGMIDVLFYIYIANQLAIAILLVVYYFTDHLYGDERKIRMEPRDIEFGKFLSQIKTRKEIEEDGIWDR
jgi:predicted membrane protein